MPPELWSLVMQAGLPCAFLVIALTWMNKKADQKDQQLATVQALQAATQEKRFEEMKLSWEKRFDEEKAAHHECRQDRRILRRHVTLMETFLSKQFPDFNPPPINLKAEDLDA